MTALNTMRVLRRGSHLCKPPPARIKSSHSPPCQLEDDSKKDNKVEDNDIPEDKTTRECKTTQEVKTTSTTHSPGNINNKKDNISVMKTTLAEKTTLEKPVCVHRRGGWCTTHGGGAKKFSKTSKHIKINADGSQKVSYTKKTYYVCDISDNGKKLKQPKISFSSLSNKDTGKWDINIITSTEGQIYLGQE